MRDKGSQVSDSELATMQQHADAWFASSESKEARSAGVTREVVSAALDKAVSLAASTRTWRIVSGSFQGLAIGDSPDQVAQRLRVLGATHLLGDDPDFKFVASTDSLPKLYSSSDFIVHPGDIRVMLRGDHVWRVALPSGNRTVAYATDLKRATTRAEVFAVFERILKENRDDPVIERVDPEPHVIDITRVPLQMTDLGSSKQWTTIFRGEENCRWQYDLRFNADGKLGSMNVLAAP